MENLFMRLACSLFIIFFSFQKTFATTPKSRIVPPLLDRVFYDSTVKQYLRFNWNIQSGSNSVSQSFLNAFYFGRFISAQSILQNEKKIDNRLRAGMANVFRLEWNRERPLFLYKKGFHLNDFSISVEAQTLFGTTLSKNAFQLIFRGNQPFQGEMLKLNNTTLRTVSLRNYAVDNLFYYQKLRKDGQWGAKLFIGFGVSQVLNSINLKLDQSSLFTYSGGDSLEANIFGVLENSGRNNFVGKGWGLHTNLNFVWAKNGKMGSVKLSRLGFINYNTQQKNKNWNIEENKPMSNSPDPIKVKQVEVNRLQLTGTNWLYERRDSLLALLKTQDKKVNKWQLAPFFLESNLMIGEKWAVGLNYLYHVAYLPQFTANYIYLKKAFSSGIKINLKGGASIGGFDTYQLNHGFTMEFLKSMANLELNMLGIESFVLGKKEHGAGIFLALQYRIK